MNSENATPRFNSHLDDGSTFRKLLFFSNTCGQTNANGSRKRREKKRTVRLQGATKIMTVSSPYCLAKLLQQVKRHVTTPSRDTLRKA